MSNIQPLEVVDRDSETQPQVVENLNERLEGAEWSEESRLRNTSLLISSGLTVSSAVSAL